MGGTYTSSIVTPTGLTFAVTIYVPPGAEYDDEAELAEVAAYGTAKMAGSHARAQQARRDADHPRPAAVTLATASSHQCPSVSPEGRCQQPHPHTGVHLTPLLDGTGWRYWQQGDEPDVVDVVQADRRVMDDPFLEQQGVGDPPC